MSAPAEFLIFQYVPDVVRKEPVNVGVAVRRGEEIASRFLGETGDVIDRRKIRRFRSSTAYVQWVRYWRRTLQQVEVGDPFTRALENSGTHYRAILGGQVTDTGDDPLLDVINYIYSLIVSEGGFAEAIGEAEAAEEEAAARSLEKALEDEFQSVNILRLSAEQELFARYPVIRSPSVRGRVVEHRPAFAQQNGRLDVIETIDLTARSPLRLTHHAGWMAYMFDDVREGWGRERVTAITVIRWSEELADDELRRHAKTLAEVEADEVVNWLDTEDRLRFIEERRRAAVLEDE